MEDKIWNFKDLRVWQLGVDFADKIYQVTNRFPDGQRHVLAKQLVRSAISVPSNIAEGSLRGSRKEFAHFINIARGSLAEAETQIIIACRYQFINKEDQSILEEMVLSLHKMLMKLRNALKTQEPSTKHQELC